MESLYTDALALAGTKVTIQRLLEKVKKLDENEAASTLQKLARNIQIVGKDSLDSIWNLCKQAQQGTTIQHACVLSWSRMANTMCSRNEKSEWGKKIGDVWTQDKQKDKDEERKPRCSEALKTELVQVRANGLNPASKCNHFRGSRRCTKKHLETTFNSGFSPSKVVCWGYQPSD